MEQNYLKYIPIDYVKGELINYDNTLLLNNHSLSFNEPFNIDTAEIGERYNSKGIKIKPYRLATYKDLKFKYYEHNKRMFISGSLHKYHNKGVHNYNSFNSEAFKAVLIDLNVMFNIEPNHIHLTQFEHGINAELPINPNRIIDSCIFYKSKRFQSPVNYPNSKYIQCRFTDYIIKIYNKSSQYDIKNNILRFERKELNFNRYAKKISIDQTLQGLIDSDFNGLEDLLLETWNNIILFDPYVNCTSNKIMRYRDPLFWQLIRNNKSCTTFMKHRKKLKSINRSLGNNTQEEVYTLLKSQIDRERIKSNYNVAA